MSDRRTIQILDPSVARKIAAGEVIERPGGVVRELLDNSLDAGASQIDVELAEGGNAQIRVVDDGCGMDRNDLERCFLPHATSKIVTDDDLLRVRTLGFRGEALSSVAAVSRLEIVSAPAGGVPHRAQVEAGRLIEIAPAAGAPGTRVTVANLFYNVPARRHFLKRAAAEYSVVRSVFLDKALPFPEVGFRLTTNGEVRTMLPPAGSVERIVAAYPERNEPAMLHEIEASGDGFRARIVAGEPGAPRKDRKNLQIFVNRRRVWEYALVQAIEYAYRDYLHGGLYPVAYLFLNVEPELVDFNIHPAKREVRFRNLPEIHRRIVAALSEFLRVFDRRAVATGERLPFESWEPGPPSGSAARPSATGATGEANPAAGFSRTPSGTGQPRSDTASAGRAAIPATGMNAPQGRFDLSRTFTPPVGSAHESSSVYEADLGFRYLGQVMDLFLVVERGDRLYLVDQHAAHERVIFDRLRNGASGQELLFPIRLEFEPEAEAVVEEQRAMLQRLGIELEQRDGGWELVTIPSAVPISAESLAALLMELLERPSDFERELYASLSCRSAVMDGDRLAPATAIEIVRGVIGLENARCPHGRPLWVEYTRDQLASLVGRT
ncbi:MAG: DNA mismatch repair endonuclease MutL [Spirochaetota bacterium]